MAWGSPSCVARSPPLPPRSHLQTETLQPMGCWLRRRLRQETAPLAQEEPNHQHKTERTGRLPGLTAPGTSEEATGPRRRPAPTRATLTAPRLQQQGSLSATRRPLSPRRRRHRQTGEGPEDVTRQQTPRAHDTRHTASVKPEGKPGPVDLLWVGGRRAGGGTRAGAPTRRPAQLRERERKACEGARPACAGLLSTAWWTGDWRDQGRCGSRKSL